jgi:hypothetical protein
VVDLVEQLIPYQQLVQLILEVEVAAMVLMFITELLVVRV